MYLLEEKTSRNHWNLVDNTAMLLPNPREWFSILAQGVTGSNPTKRGTRTWTSWLEDFFWLHCEKIIYLLITFSEGNSNEYYK